MQEKLQKKIDEIYEILRQNVGWILQGNRKTRFNEFISELSELEKGLNSSSVSAEELYDIKKKIYILESEAIRFRDYSFMLPYILFIYIGFVAIFFLITFFDIPGFIQKTMGVVAPEKLISFGIAGALLYLATSILMKSTKNNHMSTVTDFSVRIFLAILVPIILVALLFTDAGELASVKITPELISFACGYSANLVMETMNKLVEKATTMVKTI